MIKEKYLELQKYIDEHLEIVVCEKQDEPYRDCDIFGETTRPLESVFRKPEESFSQRVFKIIDQKALIDADVYKKAGIDRRLFSRIRSDQAYHPSKMTAIALALALELGLDDALDLFKTAGYTLSDSSQFDIIIKYFIEEDIYDLDLINDALYAYNEKTFYD